MAVGKDTQVAKNETDPDVESAAARRLAEALDPSAIDALLADAQAAGTPIDGADGLLNQMTKAVLDRALFLSVGAGGTGQRSALLLEDDVSGVGLTISAGGREGAGPRSGRIGGGDRNSGEGDEQ